MIEPIFKTIRDPVHKHIRLTPIEQTVIDTAEFQRLRHVLQQSTAYTTFPSNFTNRFAHSLGAMHLSGVCFKNALQNASNHDRDSFMEDARLLFKCARSSLHSDNSTERLIKDWRQLLGTACGFNFAQCVEPNLTTEKFNDQWSEFLDSHEEPRVDNSDKFRFIVNILWQSVRLATLVHDMGHLPLSHVFEFAIEKCEQQSPDGQISKAINALGDQYDDQFEVQMRGESRPKFQLHEKLGTIITSEIPRNSKHDATKSPLYGICQWIAIRILATSPPNSAHGESNSSEGKRLSVLRFLHSIIAGEVDADRLDYCVRDPTSSATEHGAFDVHSIVSNLVLWRQPQTDTYCLAVSATSTPAIEMFYAQRMASYKAIVDQHNVARFNSIAKEIIVQICGIAEKNKCPKFLKVLKNFHFISPDSDEITFGFLVVNQDKYKHFRRYDDAWLRTLFRALLDTYENACRQNDHLLKQTFERQHLDVLLDTFLHRDIKHTLSLWKHEGDYIAFAKMVEARSNNSITEKNALKWLSGYMASALRVYGSPGKYETTLSALLEAEFVSPLTKALPQGHGLVLVDFRKIRAPIADLPTDIPNLPVVSAIGSPFDQKRPMENRYLGEATDVSPFLKSMANSAVESPIWQVYCLSRNLRLSDDKEGADVWGGAIRQAGIDAFIGFVTKARKVFSEDKRCLVP